MKTTIYTTKSVLYKPGPDVAATLALLTWIGWPEPEWEVGIEEIARVTHGRVNPGYDWVLEMPNGEWVRTPIELAKMIDETGAAPL